MTYMETQYSIFRTMNASLDVRLPGRVMWLYRSQIALGQLPDSTVSFARGEVIQQGVKSFQEEENGE